MWGGSYLSWLAGWFGLSGEDPGGVTQTIPASRCLVIAPESRLLAVPAECRVLIVEMD